MIAVNHSAPCGCAYRQDAAASFGVTYKPGSRPLEGTVIGAQQVVLNLMRMPDRLWAVEMAALHRSLHDAVQHKLDGSVIPPSCAI